MDCKMYNIEHKREVLIKQSLNNNGNYYKYLRALYNLFLQKAQEQGEEYATDISMKEKMSVVANCCEKAFVSPSIIIQYQDDLKKLGYISVKNIENKWRIYITRELDF